MITYEKGDLSSADVEALVNTVNTVGVMGKGIILQWYFQISRNIFNNTLIISIFDKKNR